MTAYKNEFSSEDINCFKPSMKVGLMASINPEGLPHITLLTSMQANKPTELIFGQFTNGASKKFIQENHHIGFLVMTFEKIMWRGKATWTHMAKEGPEYEQMNLIPMFRYNTYFGINTVHYFDLLEVSESTPLPMNKIILEALKTMLGKGALRSGANERILSPYAEKIFNDLTSLKFLSYIGEDGYPSIIPVIQCQAADSTRLAFSGGVYTEEMNAIPVGSDVAVFCMNFGIEDILIRGKFSGFQRSRVINFGTVDINWVYNTMPPAIGQIYPPVELKACSEF